MKNLTEWAVQLAGRVDSFLKQRTIVALLMLYEGVMLLVQSGNTTRGMAMGIAIAIALAAGGIIAEALAQRGGKKKAIIPAILAIARLFRGHPAVPDRRFGPDDRIAEPGPGVQHFKDPEVRK